MVLLLLFAFCFLLSFALNSFKNQKSKIKNKKAA